MRGDEQRLLSIAQAWGVPVVVTCSGALFALRMAIREPAAYLPTVCIVMLLAVPAVSTALIARGLVGLHLGARLRGVGAMLLGVALLAALVLAIQGYQSPFDPARHAPRW